MSIVNFAGVEVYANTKWYMVFLSDKGQYSYAHGSRSKAGTQGKNMVGGKAAAGKKLDEQLSDEYTEGGTAAVIFSADETAAPATLATAYRKAAGTAFIGYDFRGQFSARCDDLSKAPAAPAPEPPPVPKPAPEPAAAAPKAKSVTLTEGGDEFYVRPNGERYYPRSIGAHEDVAMLRRCRSRGLSVALSGAPGCGKTALVEAAHSEHVADEYVERFLSIDGTEETTVDDFKGKWLPKQGEEGLHWFDGPLVEAMEGGKVLFVDEIGRIPGNVQAVLIPLMDGRGRLKVENRPIEVGPQMVNAAPGFAIVVAYNPLGARIPEAIKSRFAFEVDYTTDFDLARMLKVPTRLVKVAEKLDAMRRDPADHLKWSPQMRELLQARDIEVDFGMETAIAAFVSKAPEIYRSEVLKIVRDVLAKPDITILVTGKMDVAV